MNTNVNGKKYSTKGSVVEIRPAHPHNDYDVTIYIHNLVNGHKTAYDVNLSDERVVEQRKRKHGRTMKSRMGQLSTEKVRGIVYSEWDVELTN